MKQLNRIKNILHNVIASEPKLGILPTQIKKLLLLS